MAGAPAHGRHGHADTSPRDTHTKRSTIAVTATARVPPLRPLGSARTYERRRGTTRCHRVKRERSTNASRISSLRKSAFRPSEPARIQSFVIRHECRAAEDVWVSPRELAALIPVSLRLASGRFKVSPVERRVRQRASEREREREISIGYETRHFFRRNLPWTLHAREIQREYTNITILSATNVAWLVHSYTFGSVILFPFSLSFSRSLIRTHV